MSKFYFDTHMHFDLYQNRDDVLTYLEKNGCYTIAITNLPDLFEKYRLCYGRYKYVKFALGFHPELVYKYKSQIDKFRSNIRYTRYIGEIGADFTTEDNREREVQLEVLSEIVSSCNQYDDKILSVHTRKAEKQVLAILNNCKSQVILHWYSGTIREMEEAIERGYYFSINHQMIRSNNGKRIIANIPLERILIESDAPFTKGLEKNYSIKFMDDIYRFISETRNIDEEELGIILKNNFRTILTQA
ncbi:Qat anti-phage system TatD family nuclease QatD [Roseburia sp. 499]|uniref:Qat anti-phage system TatD family nuclease QatD n=1 Tax=Roseburia sp. 499 TaxID=1261634 RepID=UPI000952B799|nr:Qat anti-phage system TatD family nuclease QatD [Roseburia sp. 499]WVK69894.1 Qat anti-phage system TatD family nuclease QatD [Roseburia sp. 499]